MRRQGSYLNPTPEALTVVDRLAGLSKVISPAVIEQALLDTGRAECVVWNPLPFQGREGVAKTTYPRQPRISLCF